MSKVTEINKKMIDQVIDTIDWNQLVKFYRILKRKIGNEPLRIKGLVKSDKITVESLKDELIKVIEHVMENDMQELSYGSWVIIWTNGEWESFEFVQTGDIDNPLEEVGMPIMESKLQVLFVAQSIMVKEELDFPATTYELEGGLVLEDKLKESIENEDYILAGKIRDVLDELNKKKNEN